MKFIKQMALLSIGAAFGIGMVLSCGDSSPPRADAATCDCPSSEPPIANRLVVVTSPISTIAAGAQGGAGVMCPQGAQFLSGTCTPEFETEVRDLTLQQFGFNAQFSWVCNFKNNEATDVRVKATALCLKPTL